MLISVIIPCFNVEEYLEECVKSVLSQTYPSLEIICVDNNSTDSTYELLLQFKSQYPKLIIERELTPGASAARNKGLARAQGDWIQFLDADDLLEPFKIEHQVSIIKENPDCAFVVGSSVKLHINGARTNNIATSIDVWEGLVTGRLGNTCANLFKKVELLEVNGWDPNLRSSQEANLMFRLLRNGARVCFDGKPMTIIRARASGSISLTNLEDNLLRYIGVRIQILNYLHTIPSIENAVKETIIQVLFDRIRELYHYNKDKSVRLYKEVIPLNFKPKVSPATTKSFIVAYNLLGFTAAQRLKQIFK